MVLICRWCIVLYWLWKVYYTTSSFVHWYYDGIWKVWHAMCHSHTKISSFLRLLPVGLPEFIICMSHKDNSYLRPLPLGLPAEFIICMNLMLYNSTLYLHSTSLCLNGSYHLKDKIGVNLHQRHMFYVNFCSLDWRWGTNFKFFIILHHTLLVNCFLSTSFYQKHVLYHFQLCTLVLRWYLESMTRNVS